MATLKASIQVQKFGEMGEKTGWTYLFFTPEMVQRLAPGMKKSFRVKGCLNNLKVEQMALIPMGEGAFIMSLNADLRRKLGVREGYKVQVALTKDDSEQQVCADLWLCLEDDVEALNFFSSLPKSHQMYFSRWIEAAKTPQTREKRLLSTVQAAGKKWGFSEMMRAKKAT